METTYKVIETKVRINFADSTYYETDSNEDLEGSNIYSMLYSSETGLYARQSSTTCQLTIYDKDGLLDRKNEESPYYNKFKTGVQLEMYIRENDEETWHRYGVYYITGITYRNDALNGNLCDIDAADILGMIYSKSATQLSYKKNDSMQNILERIFSSVGISNYSIDITNKQFNHGVAFKDTIGELLSVLLASGDLMIYTDSTGTICVKNYSSSVSEESKITYGEEDTMAIAQFDTLLSSYNSYRITMHTPFITKRQLLLEVNDIIIPAGTSTEIDFDYEKITKGIRNVVVTCEDAYVELQSFTSYSKDISCLVYNWDEDNNDKSISLKVYGDIIEYADTVIEDDIGTIDVAEERNIYEIETYTDTDSSIDSVINRITSFLSNNCKCIEIDCFNNPYIRIGDKVTVDNDDYNVHGTFRVVGLNNVFNTGYQSHLTLVKV